jgi:hypothetical protein
VLDEAGGDMGMVVLHRAADEAAFPRPGRCPAGRSVVGVKIVRDDSRARSAQVDQLVDGLPEESERLCIV